MLRLYDYAPSGNAYKVRLLLSQLAIVFQRIPVDITRSEAQTPEFRKKNANQRVPVLEWPDGRILPESNAILFYLATGSAFLPKTAWQQAQVLQWQFFEQYSLQPYVGVLRHWALTGALERNRDLVSDKLAKGYRALRVMEAHLQENEFFVGDTYSIADITLYAYSHVASAGGFSLDSFPRISAWLARVASQPRHLTIED